MTEYANKHTDYPWRNEILWEKERNAVGCGLENKDRGQKEAETCSGLARLVAPGFGSTGHALGGKLCQFKMGAAVLAGGGIYRQTSLGNQDTESLVFSPPV